MAKGVAGLSKKVMNKLLRKSANGADLSRLSGKEAQMYETHMKSITEHRDNRIRSKGGYIKEGYDQKSSLPVGENFPYSINEDPLSRSSLSERPTTPGQASVDSYKINPDIKGSGFMDVGGQVLGNMKNRLFEAGGGDGWGVAKMIGTHALKGAVAGAAIGGTTEAAQGGSFWTGAKEGAFNGAVGWGAYRTLGKSVGATTRNPFGRQGAFGKTYDEWNGVSKAAKTLMQNKANVAVNKTVNNHK